MELKGQDFNKSGTDQNENFSRELAFAVLHPSAQERLQPVQLATSTGLPGLELSKVDACALGFGERIQAALTDNWAVYPGTTGLVFGATSGALAKHYALSPAVEYASRQFKIARAGVIWGLAGFAANYVGGAIASYLSNDDKLESCQRGKEIDFLKLELQKQKSSMEELSQRLRLLGK
ncbi:MAG: hypothetical protein K2Z81_27805 [Cyanobacteria bacterium]|nr:hypothetical protein [Cyanobacteriota bacterium]